MLRHAISIVTAILLAVCPIAFADADTIDAAMIQRIHANTVSSFILHCKKEMIGTDDDTCRCLAEKTQAYIDDMQLAKCQNNENGVSCISTVVSDATTKALLPQNLKACNHQQPSSDTDTDTSDDFSSDAAANTSTDASTTENPNKN